MKKPFVVIENDRIRITDLGNETSEFWFKEDNTKIIYTNAEIRAEILAIQAKEKPLSQIVEGYKHRGH